MAESKKNKNHPCGHCVSYDMWCGICLHPQSKRFTSGEDYICELPPCELFTLDPDYE